MADPTLVAIALPAKELRKEDKHKLFYIGGGYEDDCVFIPRITRATDKMKFPWQIPLEKYYDSCSEDKDALWGIPIASTWNGVIDLDQMEARIEQARKLFRELTGKEGRLYVRGEQT